MTVVPAHCFDFLISKEIQQLFNGSFFRKTVDNARNITSTEKLPDRTGLLHDNSQVKKKRHKVQIEGKPRLKVIVERQENTRILITHETVQNEMNITNPICLFH